MPGRATYKPYDQPTGGWGSVKSLAKNMTGQKAFAAAPGLMTKHNKVGGYMCTSCAWTKPKHAHAGEFCENGAKATFWDLTPKRTTPEFFEQHTLTELLDWSDYALENEGRLTHPLRYDAGLDKYLSVSWEEAFADIGAKLKTYDPKSVIFYASGRASLETSFMYQLLARLYGNNNLPDSSNMCHETTSVALPESIGTPVGTILLHDYAHTDCIFSFGQNVGTNSPRLLHSLQEVRERDVPIVVFNPLKERGWEAFVNPQRPVQMATNTPTTIATQYYQPAASSDTAVLVGIAKSLFEMEDAAQSAGQEAVLDHAFITEHTSGFEEFEAYVRSQDWAEITEACKLARSDLEAAAQTYAQAKSVIAIYGMGLTQHHKGVETVQMLVNLLLMRGNMGRPGAGICPVRGHSNVQGQRTVGISEKPHLVPLDKMAERYNFQPPTDEGLATVDGCEAIVAGRISAFIGLGGNFLRAVPEQALMEEKWREMDLSVQIATKLNRTHLIPAQTTYLLPTLVRPERDEQASGKQIVTVEDSTTCIHASHGSYQPASEHLRSEPHIVAEIAKAALPANASVPWDRWVDDYALVRDEIAAIFPKDFHDFNKRLDIPGGFPRQIGARERKWETESGKANFKVPTKLLAGYDDGKDADIFRLVTLRSNDQFNTTVYGYDDRLRGISGSRMVVMMNRADRERLGIARGGHARLTTVVKDNITRSMGGFQVIDFNIPSGTIGAYYPECNPLIPLSQFAEKSKTPAVKSVPIRIEPDHG